MVGKVNTPVSTSIHSMFMVEKPLVGKVNTPCDIGGINLGMVEKPLVGKVNTPFLSIHVYFI